MISMLARLPDHAALWDELERICPAEAAIVWAEAPLLGHGSSGLWRQTDSQGNDTGLIWRNTMGGVVLALLPDADAEELGEFLQVIGWSSLTLPSGWAGRLNLPDTLLEEGLLLKWGGGPAPMPYGYFLRPIGVEELLKHTIHAFGEQSLPPQEREEWQWAFGLRLRRETALAMGLWQRRELLAAAALTHLGRSAAVIGFVGTSPAQRGNGYGGLLAGAMAELAKEKGKRPLLCCRPELKKLYRRVGFVTMGTQTVLRPRSYNKAEGCSADRIEEKDGNRIF